MTSETIGKAVAEPVVPWTALEATRLAYERTLMAWIRTAVSMISFGFTIYKFFQYFHESQKDQVDHLVTPRALGLFMISAGLFTLLLASLEHRQCRNNLKRQFPKMPVSISLVLAWVISALGILALIAAIFRQ
jgi:putative membrane protein